MTIFKTLRQRLRLLILMLSLALFPIIIFYLSPALPFVAASQGIINGSLIVLAIQFISSLFFGRFWCGWLCPAGGVQSICGIIQPKTVKARWIRFIKYPVFIIWITSILLLLYSAGKMLNADFYFETSNGVSIAEPWQYFIYYSVLFMIAIFSLLIGRGASCSMLCMLGAGMGIGQSISRLIGLPRLRIKADASKCSGCKMCDNVCPSSIDVSNQVKKGEITSTECRKCMACIDNCPKSCLSTEYSGGRK